MYSRSSELDRVVGLEIGADDYVAKPFSPRELTVRAKVVLHRITPPDAASNTEIITREYSSQGMHFKNWHEMNQNSVWIEQSTPISKPYDQNSALFAQTSIQ